MPIWKPFIAAIAACEAANESYDTNPVTNPTTLNVQISTTFNIAHDGAHRRRLSLARPCARRASERATTGEYYTLPHGGFQFRPQTSAKTIAKRRRTKHAHWLETVHSLLPRQSTYIDFCRAMLSINRVSCFARATWVLLSRTMNRLLTLRPVRNAMPLCECFSVSPRLSDISTLDRNTAKATG